VQILGQTSLQNNRLTPSISKPASSLSSKSVTSGVYDLSAGKDTSLDIAGLTIGMSPDQVTHILTSKGYILGETIKGPSFEELVTIKRDNIRDSRLNSFKAAIKVLKFKKDVFETIEVNFLSMPGHPIIRRVGYKNVDTSLTFEKMRHLSGANMVATNSQLIQKRFLLTRQGQGQGQGRCNRLGRPGLQIRTDLNGSICPNGTKMTENIGIAKICKECGGKFFAMTQEPALIIQKSC